MCVQNDMLTIAGEARRQNGTHPYRSRKRSPVRPDGVPDSSRPAAACADSQNFTCAGHVRNWLPYRLTFRFVVILRLRNREFDTGSRLHLTVRPGPPPIGLYACTGVVRRNIGSASTRGKPPSKPVRAARSAAASPARARIVQCANRVQSRKYSPVAQHADSSGCRRKVRHTRDSLPMTPANAHLTEEMRHRSGSGNDSRKISP